SFLEGYRVAARTLGTLSKAKAGVTAKDLSKRSLATGKRMFLAGEVVRREALQRPVFDNAIASFLDQGVLASREGKLVLAESFGTIEAVKAVERRIASYLAGIDGAPALARGALVRAGEPS